MTNPTTDAARGAVRNLTAVGHKYECASVRFIKYDRHSGLDQYGASGKACDCGAQAKREALIDTYAAAVSSARDAEWRAAVEAVRMEPCDEWCANMERCDCGWTKHNAALDALLARMDGAK